MPSTDFIVIEQRAKTRALAMGLVLSKSDWLLVSVKEQRLYHIHADSLKRASFDVSTAKLGVGNQKNSYQTPTGWHVIAQKIGADCARNEILKGRQPTGDIATIETRAVNTHSDCITSRILWLKGLEAGINLHGNVDSFERYIYIHGTHEEGLIGQPASIGCVRMKNVDIIDLFECVSEGTPVFIDG